MKERMVYGEDLLTPTASEDDYEDKHKQHIELNKHTDTFLANGGKIQKLKYDPNRIDIIRKTMFAKRKQNDPK